MNIFISKFTNFFLNLRFINNSILKYLKPHLPKTNRQSRFSSIRTRVEKKDSIVCMYPKKICINKIKRAQLIKLAIIFFSTIRYCYDNIINVINKWLVLIIFFLLLCTKQFWYCAGSPQHVQSALWNKPVENRCHRLLYQTLFLCIRFSFSFSSTFSCHNCVGFLRQH